MAKIPASAEAAEHEFVDPSLGGTGIDPLILRVGLGNPSSSTSTMIPPHDNIADQNWVNNILRSRVQPEALKKFLRRGNSSSSTSPDLPHHEIDVDDDGGK
ncbi:hypothetical protein PanWU01x14_290480 [Parasponia andersonii]|uniref:Uncharacterized protein n=1 Tax=Parasponia andersonii TaxID=3476 RepID=A0A2P5AXP6_PARAD|nr:hypothetical protein PanWU01x14_290480 [Parasponia andersonii]